MSRITEVTDIAEYEETDSELAKYTIICLHSEITRLNTILNNIHTYIEKMSYCDIVDNPKKELSRILERENQ